MSSDEDDTAGDFMPSGKNKLGALFAMSSEDAKAAPTFKYQPPERKKKAKAAAAAAPSAPAGEACYLTDNVTMLFNSENEPYGKARLCIRCVSNPACPELTLAFASRDGKLILGIPLTAATYWMQRPYDTQRHYASVQDEHGRMWMVQFKNEEEATVFTYTVYSLQYSLTCLDRGAEKKTVFELMGGDGDALGDGDLAGVMGTFYKLESYTQPGAGMLQHPEAAPYKDGGDVQKMRIGEAKMSRAMDDALRGTSKGQRRVAFVENEGGETVCAVFEIAKVKKQQAAAPEPTPPPPAAVAAPPAEQSTALVVVESPAKPAPEPEPVKPAAPAEPAPTPAAAPAAPAVAAAPALPVGAGGALDTNALLTTMLLNQLGGGAKPAAPAPAAAGGGGGSGDSSEVLRGMDRLMVQMGQLYQKMDTLDMQRKLDENNDKIENMFRRVMGKAPSAGYDPLRSGIDRESDHQTLLAEIEKRDKRIEELTDSYHNALSSISDQKEETSSLRVDLQIERDTALSRLKEAAERHRLQVVEMDAKARSEKDHAVAQARREGKEEGQKIGFAEGEREAFLKHAGGSMDEVVDQLQQSRDENVRLQQELLAMQAKILDERKGHDEQIQLMNQLVAKYESRSESSPTNGAAGGMSREEVSGMLSKSLKKIMNQVYFSIEENLEDGGADAPVPPSQVLTMVTKAIKVCTKQAIANLKQELDAAAPPPPPPQDHSPVSSGSPVDFPPPPAFGAPPPMPSAGGVPPPMAPSDGMPPPMPSDGMPPPMPPSDGMPPPMPPSDGIPPPMPSGGVPPPMPAVGGAPPPPVFGGVPLPAMPPVRDAPIAMPPPPQ